MSIQHWMSWEGGVDLVAATRAGLPMPNVIVHLARMVHTPVGSAPAGMLLYQPDATQPPLAMGFVSTDLKVAAYFGPNIFAGTPFEKAPALKAHIEISHDLHNCNAKVKLGDLTLGIALHGLKPAELIHRQPGPVMPFTQQGLEASAMTAMFSVNGKDVPITIPPVGMSGGPAAVWSPTGMYAR